MKKGLDFIGCVVDKSGSMAKLVNDTVEGYNKFINDQKNEVTREAKTLLTLFDSNIHVGEIEDIKTCKLMKAGRGFKIQNSDYTATVQTVIPNENEFVMYNADGGTAYFDALGTTINKIGNYLDSLPEDEKPENVIIYIITDGEENSSHEFSGSKVKEMITHQQDVYNWAFIFAGANIDAFDVAGDLGIAKNLTMSYTANASGVANAYFSSSKTVSHLRGFNNNSTKFDINDIANQVVVGSGDVV